MQQMLLQNILNNMQHLTSISKNVLPIDGALDLFVNFAEEGQQSATSVMLQITSNFGETNTLFTEDLRSHHVHNVTKSLVLLFANK